MSLYGAKIPLDVLSDIIGCDVIELRDPYDDFDTDDEAADYADKLQEVLDAINWVFEKMCFAFDWTDFYVIFERGEYGDEPQDEDEYLKYLPEVIISKSGDLTEKEMQLIRSLDFKKFSVKESNYVLELYNATDIFTDLSPFYEKTQSTDDEDDEANSDKDNEDE